jgi:hypothetical protein
MSCFRMTTARTVLRPPSCAPWSFEHGFPVSTEEHDPILTIAVRASVSHVLDLTDGDTGIALHPSDAELHADWEHELDEYPKARGTMPATQLLALAAHSSGLVSAIEYPSARTGFGVDLVVFPDRLDAAAGDFLQVIDTTGRHGQTLPPRQQATRQPDPL